MVENIINYWPGFVVPLGIIAASLAVAIIYTSFKESR